MRELPRIGVGERVVIRFEDIEAIASGLVGARFMRFYDLPKTGKRRVSVEKILFDTKGKPITEDNSLSFHVASKEEKFQKYSVFGVVVTVVITVIPLILQYILKP
jgi:hypothetical protein